MTVAQIIVRQQTELENANLSIKKISEDFTRSQFDILGWSKKSVDELRKQNALLEVKLVDCQQQIRNFSYNIQVLNITVLSYLYNNSLFSRDSSKMNTKRIMALTYLR